MKRRIRAAAITMEISPHATARDSSLVRTAAPKIFSGCKSSLFVLEDDARLLVLLTTHFMSDYHCVSILLRDAIARALGVGIDQVFCFSSHNHCAPVLNARDRMPFDRPGAEALDANEELTGEGQELLRRAVEAARRLRDRLEPVEARYGAGKERRITHNRKGRRADGSTYLMREEDRLPLGGDFNGDIDDDAFVIGFYREDGMPTAFLGQFTGHPVTAYHCDYPVFCAEFAQVACDDLSAAFGNVPVGFLQGCAGDTNAKGLLSDLSTEQSVERSNGYGHQLGETFIGIARELKASDRADLAWKWRSVALGYKDVPPVDELEARIERVRAFTARCRAGDDAGTRFCDGLNFPRAMSVPYRAALIQPTLKWLGWALAFHRENRLADAPRELALEIAAIRIGDVGIVGLPCEPFLEIGRRIKRQSPLPMTLPCGYMHEGQDTWAYIPDGCNCDDLDYSSSWYRYTTEMLPFRRPAGDLLADAGVRMLGEIAEGIA